VVRVDSVIDQAHILIESHSKTVELYDLFGDPRQQRNLADQAAERPRKERLTRTLDALLRRTERLGPTGGSPGR
jgi:hypothetical protein